MQIGVMKGLFLRRLTERALGRCGHGIARGGRGDDLGIEVRRHGHRVGLLDEHRTSCASFRTLAVAPAWPS